MGDREFYSSTLGLLLISLAISNCQGQIQCFRTGWKDSVSNCGRSMELIYEEVNTTTGLRFGWCCKKDSQAANKMRIRANGCQVTKCISEKEATPFSSGLEREYIYQGSKIVYEEVSREPCNLEGELKVVAVYCCQKGSLETALYTTLGAEPHEFPHMAYLSGGCGGTIYNKRYILTAAHCVVDRVTNTTRKLDEYSIAKVGRNIVDVPMSENDYQIVEAIPHPKYSKMHPNLEPNSDATFNDIALVKVDRDIVFGRDVKSLQISPEGFDEIENADEAVIVGWGTTDTLDVSDHLQKANVLIRSDETCLNPVTGAWYNDTQFAPQYLCVGGMWDGKWNPTASHGDSGGPAICRDSHGYGVLCGITSFGSEECTTTDKKVYEEGCKPGIYVELDYFRTWIEEVAGLQNDEDFHKKQLYGEVVKGNSYAHQVRVTTLLGKSCGGTLITPDIVLTAGHCVNGSKYETVTVWVGVEDISKEELSGKAYSVGGFAILPNFELFGPSLEVIKNQTIRVTYADQLFGYDLALIRLNEKVDLSEFPRLPEQDEDLSGDTVELAFPRDIAKGGKMRKRDFTLLNKKECQRRINRLEKIKLNSIIGPTTLCGVEKFSGGSKCDRELGGGLICKGKDGTDVICGVQKFRLCDSALPTAFENVAHASDWVKSTIQYM